MAVLVEAYDRPPQPMTMLDPDLEAIRAGDEKAFEQLTRRHYPAMLRIAMSYVGDRALAEDVIQETWITFLQNLDRFAQRSSLRTWLIGILINHARARRRREERSIPFSSLLSRFDSEPRKPTVDPTRFNAAREWSRPPSPWSQLPDDIVESRETLAEVRDAIAALPAKLRDVITLRDVAGWSAEQVCETLGISSANQRVRLHRARTAVRQKLEERLG